MNKPLFVVARCRRKLFDRGGYHHGRVSCDAARGWIEILKMAFKAIQLNLKSNLVAVSRVTVVKVDVEVGDRNDRVGFGTGWPRSTRSYPVSS